MKRLFIILFILCTWVVSPMMQAQIYTTSSVSHRSESSVRGISLPGVSPFRSTSAYTIGTTGYRTYSTASMHVANTAITTVASQLKGGVTTYESVFYTDNMGSGPRRVPWVPDENEENTDTPIGEGWDVALLLALLCVGYVVWKYLSVRRSNG